MNSEEVLSSLEKNFDKYEEIELILLKGHLIIEQLINEALLVHMKDEKALDRLNIMFSKKIDLLTALEGEGSFSSKTIINQLMELNRIRNKLAHHLEFNDYHNDLKKWACSVLGYTPKTIDRKETYRNTVRHAFYRLTGYLVGSTEMKKAFINKKN